jgi:peptide/nickel transport system substrate-binding protein
MRRRSFLAGSAIAGLGIANPGVSGRAQAQAQKTVNVGVGGLPDSLKTGISSFTALTLSIQTNDTLLWRNSAGELKPALALEWRAIDPLTWRFRLREGVRFHDGAPFTAEDVKFTIDYVLNPQTLYGSASRIAGIAETRVIDPMTVDIVTRAPFPTLLLALGEIVIEPKHYHAQAGAEGMTRRPLGTGPFVFQRWVPADRYELTANPNYWGGRPKLDRLVIRQIPEGATRVASLLAGETHVIEEIPVDLAPRVRDSRAAELAPVETSGSLVLTFDTRRPPFNDPRLRLAVDLAIDKELINRQILGGTARVLDGQLVTRTTFGYNPAIRARGFDPDQARRLIAEAGHAGGLSTTIATRSGRYVSDVEIANAIGGMLGRVGIRTAINVVENGVWTRMASAADMGPLHMVGWYSVGDADFNTVWYTRDGRRAFWENAEYERLFVAARSTVDTAERLAAYHRMMAIMHEENPSVFLYGLPSIYGKSRRLAAWEAPEDRLMRFDKADLA